MSEEEKNNYTEKIINTLLDHPFGLSITEIAEKTGFHRNTVSKYMQKLEGKSSVNKKQIGTASIYTTRKRKYLRRNLVVSFIQALVLGLKAKFPKEENKFKETGKLITEHFQFPIEDIYFEEFKKVKNGSDTREKLKLFQLFYNSFDFFQDDIEIKIIELSKNKIIYRLFDSEFFDQSKQYEYFFYILCGITEGIYQQNLNLAVEVNVEKYVFSKKKGESYIDISLKIQ
ncbi:MAG: hypothetical protein BAJALOKI1v1_1280007 [Promethearchaeota archaeon]|nr:MAG: hypothetical protein BAJALOKI1v1_1280007 [Candidatus Lokiarchaeota archaeon]